MDGYGKAEQKGLLGGGAAGEAAARQGISGQGGDCKEQRQRGDRHDNAVAQVESDRLVIGALTHPDAHVVYEVEGGG